MLEVIEWLLFNLLDDFEKIEDKIGGYVYKAANNKNQQKTAFILARFISKNLV